MKKQAIVLLIGCVAATSVYSVWGQTHNKNEARLEKERMMQEEYFKKHGKRKQISPPAPVGEEEAHPIDIASLKKIAPEDIATMQFYRVEWVDLQPVKTYLSAPFGDDSRQEIDAIMGLIEQAPNAKAGNLGEPLNGDPDRALVIRLVDGAAYEILYNSLWSSPFGSVKSRRLKEALYGLSCNSNRIAIMQVQDDKKIAVTPMRAQSVQRSGITSNGLITVALKLTTEGDLVLSLKAKDSSRTRILVDGRKVIQYGSAVVFNTLDGKDMFIAYLLDPVF